MTDMHWAHRDCGQPVVFDLSGGFCTGCHAENLERDDLIPHPDWLTEATIQARQPRP